MTREFKRTFFSSGIAVLLIISNLICLKYTVFAKYVLPISFITYPLISLSIVMLVDMFGRRTAKHSVVAAFILQTFMLLIYLLVTKLSSQSIFSDLSIEVNRVFEINIPNIITSLISYAILSYITINLFEGFKAKGQRSIGAIVSIFVFTILYGAIYILITNYKQDFSILLKLLYTHLISAFFMTMIGYGLYYVLRENEEIVLPEYSKVPDKSIKTVLEEEKIKVEKPKKKATKRKKTTKEKTKK